MGRAIAVNFRVPRALTEFTMKILKYRESPKLFKKKDKWYTTCLFYLDFIEDERILVDAQNPGANISGNREISTTLDLAVEIKYSTTIWVTNIT